MDIKKGNVLMHRGRLIGVFTARYGCIGDYLRMAISRPDVPLGRPVVGSYFPSIEHATVYPTEIQGVFVVDANTNGEDRMEYLLHALRKEFPFEPSQNTPKAAAAKKAERG